jgi:integrase/recombinase XerD
MAVARMSRELLEKWQRDANIRGMAEATIKNYSCDIQAFMAFCESKAVTPLAADREILRAWVDSLRQRGNKTQTIQRSLAAISSFFDFYLYEEEIENNPVGPVRKRYLSCYKTDSEKGVRQSISVEQAAKLVGSIFDPRDQLVLVLLLKTGIRRKELLAIDVDDINWKNDSIRLKPTKKRSNLTVFFDDETARLLRRWLAVREARCRNGTRALFISSWGEPIDRGAIHYIVRQGATRAGLHDESSSRLEDHFSAHCCRHFFTTQLYKAGMSREHIMWLRGDAPLSAFDGYLHLNPEDVRRSYLAHIPQLGV